MASRRVCRAGSSWGAAPPSRPATRARGGRPARRRQTDRPPPPPSAAPSTARSLFGAPISLTGSTAKEGGLTRDGYEIWRDTYNKAGGINVGGKHYRIETKYYDDESNAPAEPRRWPKS